METLICRSHSQISGRIRIYFPSFAICTRAYKQAFGIRSKQSLSDLVFDKQVMVETAKKDKYGREIGKILLYTGQDVNLEQVTRGFAWHYKAYEREQSANDRKLYGFAELDARNGRRGLWADVAPVQPWEFRHHQR